MQPWAFSGSDVQKVYLCLACRHVSSRGKQCADTTVIGGAGSKRNAICRIDISPLLVGSCLSSMTASGQKWAITSSLLMMELACIMKPDQSRSRVPTPALFSQPLLAPGRKARRCNPCPRGAGKKFKKCHGA